MLRIDEPWGDRVANAKGQGGRVVLGLGLVLPVRDPSLGPIRIPGLGLVVVLILILISAQFHVQSHHCR